MVSDASITALSGRDIARKVGDGELSAEAVTEAFLDHIAAVDGPVAAWQYLGADSARRAARALDASPDKGLLAGIPVGVKDVIDTSDMPTGYGSKVYEGTQPVWDAPCVALTRAAGGIILGVAQTVGAAINPEWQILSGHLAFLVVLLFKPRGLFPRAVD